MTDDYKKGNNRFTGKIDKVTIDLKKTNVPAAAVEKEIEEKEGKAYLDQD